MSLFPAYNAHDSDNNVKENEAGPSWLHNNSFSVPDKQVTEVSSKSDDSSDGVERRKKRSKNHSKKKKKHKRESKENSEETKVLFYEDTQALTSNSGITVPQVKLTKPVRSHDIEKKKKKKKNKRKKEKVRYFQKKLDEENEERNSLTNPEPMDIQEFLKQTEIFNKALRNEPHNIKMWLDYVKLQDSGIGSVKGRAEKKLSILDRSLEVNPDVDELLNEKMMITESIFPFDRVAAEAKSIVSKYPRSMAGWQWTINSLQFSLSKMAAPGVLIKYEKALEGINKSYHDSDRFLDLLLQCGLFLRQSGLWEQLWILIELYLELNLTTAGSGAFKVTVNLPEDEIQQKEDGIITSGLPLGALWLRIESLREGIHFFPVEESSDPQRMAFKEDLTQLLFPIAQTSFSRLILNCLLLLKVPPLPLSEAFYRYTRLNKIQWSLCSVEVILAAKFSLFSGKDDYLDSVQKHLCGPQYLIGDLGQKEFFDFVNTVFFKCITHSRADTICFLVWQMRWWRWTYSIQKKRETNENMSKTFLNHAKNILKQHRDCIPLYIEYALLEYESGDIRSCLKVLETTMNLRSSPIMAGTLERRHLCALYKDYIELLIKDNLVFYKEKILIALIALAFGEHIRNIVLRDDLISKCNEKFTHITTEVLRDARDDEVELSQIIFPDYTVSWLTCHAWFLFIHEGIKSSRELLEKAIDKLEKCPEKKEGNLIDVILEQLYVSLVNIMIYYSSSNSGEFSVLYDSLMRAIQHFPNNPVFYNTAYNCEIVGLKWQKMSSMVLSSGSALASAFIFFITQSRLLKEQAVKVSTENRLNSLLERLRNSYERCPLFWRLLLQASGYKDREDIKRLFYRSIEKCPWVKILYYEAAKILPEDLPEIQDLLVEKELRLHITPEELEILRQGP